MTLTVDNDDLEERPRPQRWWSGGSRRARGVLLLLFVCGVVGSVFLIPAIQGMRKAALRERDKHHLEQIGLALHNYHELFHAFPPGGIVREDSAEIRSWQACLLPHLEQAALHSQIKPDYAWHSPENRGVFSQPIATLMNPAIPVQPGQAVSHYAGNSHLFEINKSWDYRHITDGMSNTIGVGDVSTGFKPWGSPGNVRDPGLGIGHTPSKFGSPFPGGCHFLLLDGSVKFISENIDRQKLLDLATPAGYVWGEDASF